VPVKVNPPTTAVPIKLAGMLATVAVGGNLSSIKPLAE